MMLFRSLAKAQFKRLINAILQNNEVIGPKKVAVGQDGKVIHHYLPVERFSDIDLDYETTEFSAKTYLLPFEETLSDFSFDESDWNQLIKYRIQPRAIVGLHACDINALLKLDKVHARDFHPSPYYVARRRNTFIIGVDHEPCEGGFCRSLGTDTVTQGFDLFLTDLGDRYFVSICSDRGYSALQLVETKEITESDTEEYRSVRRHIGELFEHEINIRNLPNLLDIEFNSTAWNKWGEQCLSCGTCAMVCPTCYCYGVKESLSMDFQSGAKVKQLYSCNIVDFSEVAGGHNFRADPTTRLKYRYYHQHRGFVEAYDEPKCVGCNRCSRACVPRINPVEVICDLQEENRK